MQTCLQFSSKYSYLDIMPRNQIISGLNLTSSDAGMHTWVAGHTCCTSYQLWWGGGVPCCLDLCKSLLVALGQEQRESFWIHMFPQCGVKNLQLWRLKGVGVNCHLATCDYQAVSLLEAFGRRWGKIKPGFWIYNLSQINQKT